MTIIDVAVLGNGPAGATTALNLALAGRSVVLLGRRASSQFRTGEVICPEVCSTLIQLSLWQRFLGCGPQPAHGIWSAWGQSSLVAKDFVLSPHGPAWRVDRSQFDQMLIAAARDAGAQIDVGLRGIAVQRDGNNKWRITAVRGKKRISLAAHFVVDATGRGAAVARANGARRMQHDRLVALIGHLIHTATSDPAADVLLIESVPRGWWYSLAMPDGQIVACFVTDADLVDSRSRTLGEIWSEALATAVFTKSRAADLKPRAIRACSAAVGCLNRAAGPGWIAVGDAAKTIDPLAGMGIMQALQSSILCAGAVNEALSGAESALDEYANQTHKEFDAMLKIGSQYYRSERRWTSSAFWRRRHYGNS